MFQNLAAAVDYSYQTPTTGSSAGLGVIFAIYGVILLIAIFIAICQWKIFKKAGRPGWAAIVPVYNLWVLLEITGYPGWIALLSFVPFASIVAAVFSIMASFKLAKLFGKSDGFAVCNVLFPFVTYPILAYGPAEFMGTPGSQSMPGGVGPLGPSNSSTPASFSPPAAPAQAAYTPPAPMPPVAPQPPVNPIS